MAEKAGVAGYDKAQWQKKPPRKASAGPEQPMMAALRADYFGAASFGTITGISSLIVMLGMMVV